MFTDNLIKLRQEAGLSQQSMAESLAITRATYIKLENGRKSPRLSELAKIARIFEVEINTLIDQQSIDTERPAIKVKLPVKPSNSPRPQIKLNPLKLENILLYVLGKVGAKPNMGETVLYKILYFIDFDYYERFGRSITGMQYYRNHYGPTPGAGFRDITKAMIEAGELTIIQTKFHDRIQKKYIAGTEANLQVFNGQEIRHIDDVLSRLSNKTATEISDYAHRDTPWLITKPRGVIEYQLAKYRTTLTATTAEEDEL